MMRRDTQERAVLGFIVRVTGILFLRNALALAAGWCFVWGVMVLLLRSILGLPSALLLWGLVGLGVAVVLAGALALRRVPSRRSIRALLDRSCRCGGLLMTSSEADVGVWLSRIPPVSAPGLRWRGRRTLGVLGAAGAFVAISFAVPQRYVTPGQGRPLNVENEAAGLREQIEVLEEEQIIEPQQAHEMEKKLERIAAEASAEDPAKTWEALDHLEDAVANAAREPVEDALNETQRLAEAESLAKGLAEAAAELDPATLASAMKELADRVSEAGLESGLLEKSLPEEILEACESGSLQPGQCRELAECLGECRGAVAQRLARLAKAGLIRLETLDLNATLGQCNSEGMAEFLKEHDGAPVGLSCSELIDSWLKDGLPGRGDVTRGRGDAPMTWTDPSSEEGTDFTEQVLPPASVAALKESRLIGVSIGAPKAEAADGTAGTGALGDARAGGGSAHTHTVLPRHKGAVKRYFERDEP